MQPAANQPVTGSPPELTPRDREWLTLYIDCNEDLQALTTRLATQHAERSTQHDSGPRTQDAGPFLLDLAAWLRTQPVRAALADWDYARRRARAAREDAGTRLAVDHLMTVCRTRLDLLSYAPPAPSGYAGPLSGGPRLTGDSLNSLAEVRRAATTALRALSGSGAMATARRGYAHRHARPVSSSESPPAGAGPGNVTGSRTHSGSSHIAHRSSLLASLGPADAERFLDKERRENDRLARLLDQTLVAADALRAPGGPPDIPSLRTAPDQHTVPDIPGGSAPEERAAVAGGAASRSEVSPRNTSPTGPFAPEGRAGSGTDLPPDAAWLQSSLGGGFKPEGRRGDGGEAPIECIAQDQSPDRASRQDPDDLDELDDLADDAELDAELDDADPEGTLAIAQHVLRAVESGAPEAADFAPELIEAARVYVSTFPDPTAPNTS